MTRSLEPTTDQLRKLIAQNEVLAELIEPLKILLDRDGEDFIGRRVQELNQKLSMLYEAVSDLSEAIERDTETRLAIRKASQNFDRIRHDLKEVGDSVREIRTILGDDPWPGAEN